jgi:hypothetical protein
MRSYIMKMIHVRSGKTYFRDLLNTTTAEHNTSHDYAHANEKETKQGLENEPPYIFDIEIAIQPMRNNKASGTANTPFKLCKKGGQMVINMLHSLTLCVPS